MTYKPKLLTLAESGSGAALTASNGGVIYSNASTMAVLAGTATANKVLMSGSSTTPSWSTPTFPNASATSGKFIQSDGTNWIASTPTIPATAGTSGKVLISDGTNFVSSTPTFPNASATTRKIIVSDGANWVASTETYAVPGTSGNVLTSDGTNWTSAPPSGGSFTVLSATGTLTNAQLKAINTTPVTIVAAPGSGKLLVPLVLYATFNYGGTNAFTGVNTLNLIYNGGVKTNGTPSSFLIGSEMTGTASATRQSSNTGSGGTSLNKALEATAAADYGGNAANNNTVTYTLFYYIVTP